MRVLRENLLMKKVEGSQKTRGPHFGHAGRGRHLLRAHDFRGHQILHCDKNSFFLAKKNHSIPKRIK